MSWVDLCCFYSQLFPGCLTWTRPSLALLGPHLSSSTGVALGELVERSLPLLWFRHIPFFQEQDTASCQGQQE